MFEKRHIKAWRDQQAAVRAAFEQADTTVELIRGAVSKRYESENEERFGARLGPHYQAGIISDQLRVGLGVGPQWDLLHVHGDHLEALYQEPAVMGARLIRRGAKQIRVAVHLWIDPNEWTETGQPVLRPVQAKPQMEEQWIERTLRLVADNVFQHEDAGLLWSPDDAMRQRIRATIDRLRQLAELGRFGHAEHRRVLGVSVDASPDEIKAAWRRYAAEHHPDRGGDNERFKRGKLAYEALVA